MPTALIRPASIAEVQAAVRAAPPGARLLARGRGTKPPLSTPPEGAVALDVAGLSGIIEYEPGEFTFTALAGTPIAEIAAALAEHGQFLPFDPPLVEAGATLGGTVAAGLSGPGRYRYGGVRDFILGVRYVDGAGEVVRTGGKVVKNAAGFDISKLMAGSLGALGVLVELSFKVFPKPEAYATLRVPHPTLDAALATLHRLTGSQMDFFAIDLAPTPDGVFLEVRLGGLAAALPERLARLRGLTGGGAVLLDDADAAHWRAAREFAWRPEDSALVKVPVTPGRIARLEAGLSEVAWRITAESAEGAEKTKSSAISASSAVKFSPPRRYSAGGQVAWLTWPPAALDALDAALKTLDLSGLVVLGQPDRTRLGVRNGQSFERRVKVALDPDGRFVEV
jgi:glycolate oxidase FAD binding subunit